MQRKFKQVDIQKRYCSTSKNTNILSNRN